MQYVSLDEGIVDQEPGIRDGMIFKSVDEVHHCLFQLGCSSVRPISRQGAVCWIGDAGDEYLGEELV